MLFIGKKPKGRSIIISSWLEYTDDLMLSEA